MTAVRCQGLIQPRESRQHFISLGMENFDYCTACNAELDESTHCPACGSAVPGRESTDSSAAEPANDLGFKVVQGADMSQDDYSDPPVVEPPAPAEPPELQPVEEPPVAPSAPPPPSPPVPTESSDGLELESMVDPADMREASDATGSGGGGLELESMIPTAQPVSPVEVPSPPPDDTETPMDLSLEMVEPEVEKAPPPIPEEKKTVERSGRPTGATPRASASAPARSTSDRISGVETGSHAVGVTSGRKKKKKMGAFGFLVRVALFFGIVVASMAIAYPQGIQMLRDLASEIPLIGGGKGIRYVTNMLVEPVEVYVDGILFGEIPADGRMEVPVRAGDELTVSLINPVQTSGSLAGDEISFPLIDPMVAGDDEHHRINSHSGPIWIFAPLVSNPTDRDMMALINAGTRRARPCNCVIPAGARDHHIGYYAFEAGLRIRFVDADSDYNSRRYREVRDVTRGVAANSGAVSVTIPRR